MKRIGTFLSGMLAAALLAALVLPTLAASGWTVTIQPGISVFLNDQKITPRDANGNPVEVFTYKGTTYLPVRAICDALNQPVQWDGKTRSVYIGEHTGTEPAVWVCDLDYFDKDGKWEMGETTKDNLGVEHRHSVHGGEHITYKLNGRYSRLTGSFFLLYEKRAVSSTLVDIRLTIYGDNEKLWSGVVNCGVDPLDLDINVTGVEELKLSFNANAHCAAIGDLGLWT